MFFSCCCVFVCLFWVVVVQGRVVVVGGRKTLLMQANSRLFFPTLRSPPRVITLKHSIEAANYDFLATKNALLGELFLSRQKLALAGLAANIRMPDSTLPILNVSLLYAVAITCTLFIQIQESLIKIKLLKKKITLLLCDTA